MRRISVIVCAGLLVAASAFAQQAPANAVSGAITQGWEGAKRNIRQSAEQMGEGDYAFRPVDTVRTFGQILSHVAGANYVFCSAAKGEQSPFAEDHFEKSAKSKADIVKALEGSFTYCDGAYKALTDSTAGASITMPFGMGSGPRASALMMNTGHLLEHYGNLVTYFRLKGMVPPTSRQQ